jgi:hypothetical protein
MILEVNQPIEKMVSELLATPIVGDILVNDREVHGDYMFFNPFANLRLLEIFGDAAEEIPKD